jgi:hypothetical protein
VAGELIHSYKLDWDDAEAWATESLARSLLKPDSQRAAASGDPSGRETGS